MSVSVWQQGVKPQNTATADVAVIGAGIAGSYAAYRLAEAGKTVALLEASFPAAGATGRNAGMCLMGAADNYASGVERFGRNLARELWHLTAENQRITLELMQQFGLKPEKCGSLILAIDELESRQLEQAYQLMREDAMAAQYFPSDPLERGFGSAIYQPGDFGLDPAQLVNALLANATPGKLTLYAPAEVYAVHELNGKLQVMAKGITVDCEQVLFCTNAYSARIHPFFRAMITPVRGQILLTSPLPPHILDQLVYANYGYEYFRQFPDGTFLMGGGRSSNKETEIGYDNYPTAAVQNTLEAFMNKYFPEVLQKAKVVRRWAGTMGFSVDGLPMAGAMPFVPGDFLPVAANFDQPAHFALPLDLPLATQAAEVYLAMGFTGHGMGWGIVTVNAVLDLMLSKQSTAGIFDYHRLATTSLTPKS